MIDATFRHSPLRHPSGLILRGAQRLLDGRSREHWIRVETQTVSALRMR